MTEGPLEPKPAGRCLTGKYLRFNLHGEAYGIDVLKKSLRASVPSAAV